MDRVKKILGRVFVVLFACMSMANVVKAAGTASTDVQITIEAPEMVGETNDDSNAESEMESNIESVKTGDATSTIVYVTGAVMALAIAIFCIIKKKKKKVLMVIAAILLSATCLGHTSQAADNTENVNVTIPTSISVVFDGTGITSVSEFEISNQSLVPITVEKINATECNDWKLAENTEDITVNTKKIAFSLEGQCLQAGENAVDISIPEESSKKLDIQVERGAWTESEVSETALNLEFEYSLGTKAFQLSFDANGGSTDVTSMTAHNGETINLPEAERDGYVFKGWQDEKGNLYTSVYVMPVGNVRLTAKWQDTTAYAVYSKDDHSLTFYRSETPISVGTTYNGKNVTAVYTGFENATYGWGKAPWYSYCNDITSIVFYDKISPINTDYWFLNLTYVKYADVEKLDMSNVTSMKYMFYYVGCYSTEMIYKGLEKWDVSNVTSMVMSFEGTGCGVDIKKVYIGDLSKWNVTNVTNMMRMFCELAHNSPELVLTGLEKWDTSNVTNMSMMFWYAGYSDNDWTLDLSSWNVSSIQYHTDFDGYVQSKIIDPKWLN